MTAATRTTLAAELQSLVTWLETTAPLLRDVSRSLTISGDPVFLAEEIDEIAHQAERNASHAAKILAAK